VTAGPPSAGRPASGTAARRRGVAGAEEALGALLGVPVRVVGRLRGDGGATTWRVETAAHGLLVAKSAPRGTGPDLLRSARAQRAAGAAGVPVPRVLLAAERGRSQHLVSEHVDGTPWAQVAPTARPADRDRVLGQLAEVLRRLGTVGWRRFGELPDADAPVAEVRGPAERVALRARTRARVTDPVRAAVAMAALDRHGGAFDRVRPVLVHGDLHHGNVLVRRDGDGWTLAAVVDWDSAWAGPDDADAARAALWDDMPGDAGDLPAGTARTRALLHQLLWCLEHPATTERHRADTARTAALLGIDVP
jgi:aminoglycoside phosphotransferase (APT) family kinase protein